MADILVYSDVLSNAKELAWKGKEFAGALGLGISAAALGADAAAEAAELGAYGADKIYVSTDAAFDGLPTDVVADALAQIATEAGATYVLLGSTRRGKELAGRLAQKLDAGAVTDVSAMAMENGELVGAHFSFGGATVARETLGSAVKVFAVMPKAFEMGDAVAGAGQVVTPALTLKPLGAKLVDRRKKEGAAVNLDAAERLVCIGRGLNKKEDLPMVEELCAALAAEMGCTKSLCDFEWLPEEPPGGPLRRQDQTGLLPLGRHLRSGAAHGGNQLLQTDRRHQQGRQDPHVRHGGLRPGGRPLRPSPRAHRRPQEQVAGGSGGLRPSM